MTSVFGTLLAITLVCRIYAASELLQNADFESTSFSGNWVAVDCTLTSRTDDKFHGAHSVMISNRRVLCHCYWTLIYTKTYRFKINVIGLNCKYIFQKNPICNSWYRLIDERFLFKYTASFFYEYLTFVKWSDYSLLYYGGVACHYLMMTSCFGRHNASSSVRQNFSVTAGKNYVVSMLFKILNLPAGHQYTKVTLMVALTVNGMM